LRCTPLTLTLVLTGPVWGGATKTCDQHWAAPDNLLENRRGHVEQRKARARGTFGLEGTAKLLGPGKTGQDYGRIGGGVWGRE